MFQSPATFPVSQLGPRPPKQELISLLQWKRGNPARNLLHGVIGLYYREITFIYLLEKSLGLSLAQGTYHDDISGTLKPYHRDSTLSG